MGSSIKRPRDRVNGPGAWHGGTSSNAIPTLRTGDAMTSPSYRRPRSRVTWVDDVMLRIAPVTAAEIEAAAFVARADAGLLEAGADYLIVAVPPGTARELHPVIAAAADAAVDALASTRSADNTPEVS